MERLPANLKELVHESVEILGLVIRHELGDESYERIEALRAEMASLRTLSRDEASLRLRTSFQKMSLLSPEERMNTARAFTLMLEVMNACENAYRSFRISKRKLNRPQALPDSVIYVLTAHPTEARSPGNVAVFHEVLKQMIPFYEREPLTLVESDRTRLRHSLELAWKTSVVRNKKPRVQDEADHIYSTVLREETLETLLKCARELAPLYIRSWVGGDKDGHPGVDEKVFAESLLKSRKLLLVFTNGRLKIVRRDLVRISSGSPGAKKLLLLLAQLEVELRTFAKLNDGEGRKLLGFRKLAAKFHKAYVKEVGVIHPQMTELKTLLHIFPALVVPLEFRESSDVLLSDPSGKSLAIVRMLKKLQKISKGGDPRWYVRAFIVSMTNEIGHLEAAASFVVKILGGLVLPVVPLFEQASALQKSSEILEGMLASPVIGPAIRGNVWKNQVELMLGYSDSAKESGVLRSRIQVSEAIHRLDRLCVKRGITPIFFHGSGGSTDRGGGSIEEQMGWWPAGALRNYKVTVQGEMVERSLASPEITRGQIEKIVQAAGAWKTIGQREPFSAPILRIFADRVAEHYQETVHDPGFLQVIGQATPYPFLDLLKIGSRPTKRSTSISVEGLRAIPWILCWTQTRTLFPTWWGIGSAWAASTPEEKRQLKDAFKTSAVFKSYVRALGYTLVKVRLSIWRIYLDESQLEPRHREAVWKEFNSELDLATDFAKTLVGDSNLIAWRPWLEESIHLRSPMIHPLNLLQILAMKERDESLLRITVTGIASGMMTTG